MKAAHKRFSVYMLSVLIAFGSLFSITAQAAMVSTPAAVSEQIDNYDRQQLLNALNQQGVRDQLIDMGVNPELVEQRIAVMTPDELAQLNTELENMPAGQGAAGILLTIFIVFVITDMLCATDLFSFVKCINK